MTTKKCEKLLSEKFNLSPEVLELTSEKTLLNQNVIKTFKDNKTNSIFETIAHSEDEHIDVKCLSGPLLINHIENDKILLNYYFNSYQAPENNPFLENLFPKFFTFSLLQLPETIVNKNQLNSIFTDKEFELEATGSIVKIILRDFGLQQNNSTLSKLFQKQFKGKFNEIQPGCFELIEKMNFKELYSFFRLAGFIHDKETSKFTMNIDHNIEHFKKMSEEVSFTEYISEYKDGLIYLVPYYESSLPILGPYLKPEDVEDDTYVLNLEIIHYPKDLIFDLEYDEDDDRINVYFGSNLCLGYDNLGGHNVLGLPDYFSSNDMENMWGIKYKTISQIKADLINCGFEYDNFLKDH